jgi:hypothetical protein
MKAKGPSGLVAPSSVVLLVLSGSRAEFELSYTCSYS